MSSLTYWLKPLSAADLVDRVAKVPERFAKGGKFSLTIQSNIGELFFAKTPVKGFSAAASNLAERLRRFPASEIRDLLLANEAENKLRFKSDKDGTRFILESSGDAMTAEMVMEALSSEFTLIPHREFLESTLGDAEQQTLRHFEDSLHTLGKTAADIISSGAKQTLDLQTSIKDLSEELERKFLERKKELEDGIAAKTADFIKEKEAWEASVKGYELRENTAIRRKLLNDILERHSKREEFKFSSNTETKRAKVLNAFVLLLGTAFAVGCTLLMWQLIGTTQGKALDWQLVTVGAVLVGVFVATAIYFIKWNDKFFRDHADAELNNSKWAQDIMRASWIAELYIELRKNSGPELPPELLQSFTQNLFTPGADGSNASHPYEEVLGALKSGAEVKAGKDSIELKIGKR
jgi:hypothetical protein